MRKRGMHGKINFGCLTLTLLLIVGGYVGYKFGRVYLGKYMFDRKVFEITGDVAEDWNVKIFPSDGDIVEALLKEARRHGYYGMFIRAYDYQQAYFNGERYSENATLVQRAREVDVLILDDLGKELSHDNSTSVSERVIEALIRERMEEQKVTIITTNISSKEDMEERYETSFVRAMRGAFAIVDIDGPSHRDDEKEEINKFMNGEGDSEMRSL